MLREFYKPWFFAHNLFLSAAGLELLLSVLEVYTNHMKKEHDISGAVLSNVCDSGRILFDKMQFWLWVTYLSKFHEIFDTVFLCVTMRRVIPRHWIHHVLTPIIDWIGLETKMGLSVDMNSFIHFFMYAYYAYKVVYPNFEPWWKESLTGLQMLQFVIIIAGLSTWTYLSQNNNVQGSYGLSTSSLLS
jgi:hypothetical protein